MHSCTANNETKCFAILSFIKLSNLDHLKNQYFFFKIIYNGPFGSIQLILSGDFLPPVATYNECNIIYMFSLNVGMKLLK